MKFNAMDKYFYYNRIENIKEVAGMIQRLVPNARVGIGHGQMEGRTGRNDGFHERRI
jgi:transcription-repair coupling factor (superfamily II helicase)